MDQDTSRSRCRNSGFKQNEGGPWRCPHSFNCRCQLLRMWTILCGPCHLLMESEGMVETWSHKKVLGVSQYVSGLPKPEITEGLGMPEMPAIREQVGPETRVMIYIQVEAALFLPPTRPWKSTSFSKMKSFDSRECQYPLNQNETPHHSQHWCPFFPRRPLGPGLAAMRVQ